jgi:hypothetical protein
MSSLCKRLLVFFLLISWGFPSEATNSAVWNRECPYGEKTLRQVPAQTGDAYMDAYIRLHRQDLPFFKNGVKPTPEEAERQLREQTGRMAATGQTVVCYCFLDTMVIGVAVIGPLIDLSVPDPASPQLPFQPQFYYIIDDQFKEDDIVIVTIVNMLCESVIALANSEPKWSHIESLGALWTQKNTFAEHIWQAAKFDLVCKDDGSPLIIPTDYTNGVRHLYRKQLL